MPIAVPRLKRRTDFLRTARGGRKAALPGLILQALKTEKGAAAENDAMRVGFTVSKKVGNAVERNRVKRRLRALAEKILPDMARKGWDYVIIGRRAALERPFDLLEKDLKAALERTGTWRGGPAVRETGREKKPA